MLGDERFKKAEGETFHQKGQKVWLVDRKTWTVTVKPRKGKCLGEVSKDSIWPDMWVTVDLWNKEEASAYWNRNIPKAVVDAVRLRTIQNLAKRKAKGPRGPYIAPKKKRKKVDPIVRRLVWIKSKGICHYCGIQTVFEGPKNFEKPEDNQFTVDHLVPVALGGSESRANLVGSCRECNHKKGDLPEVKFRRVYAEYLKTKGSANAGKTREA
jgi:5-methylcytosine-specific restriction endonuclease McrA